LKGTVKIPESFAGDALINGKKRTIHVACIFQGQFEANIHINAEKSKKLLFFFAREGP
jgi:hypothetical protein